MAHIREAASQLAVGSPLPVGHVGHLSPSPSPSPRPSTLDPIPSPNNP